MKNETRAWLSYADENLASAIILLEQELMNACLQNAQQAVEKYLKALLVEKGSMLRKTHSINELATMLAKNDINMDVAAEDCDLLDAVYLPTKYPLGGALPDFEPDVTLCSRCLVIAETVAAEARKIVKT